MDSNNELIVCHSEIDSNNRLELPIQAEMNSNNELIYQMYSNNGLQPTMSAEIGSNNGFIAVNPDLSSNNGLQSTMCSNINSVDGLASSTVEFGQIGLNNEGQYHAMPMNVPIDENQSNIPMLNPTYYVPISQNWLSCQIGDNPIVSNPTYFHAVTSDQLNQNITINGLENQIGESSTSIVPNPIYFQPVPSDQTGNDDSNNGLGDQIDENSSNTVPNTIYFHPASSEQMDEMVNNDSNDGLEDEMGENSTDTVQTPHPVVNEGIGNDSNNDLEDQMDDNGSNIESNQTYFQSENNSEQIIHENNCETSESNPTYFQLVTSDQIVTNHNSCNGLEDENSSNPTYFQPAISNQITESDCQIGENNLIVSNPTYFQLVNSDPIVNNSSCDGLQDQIGESNLNVVPNIAYIHPSNNDSIVYNELGSQMDQSTPNVTYIHPNTQIYQNVECQMAENNTNIIPNIPVAYIIPSNINPTETNEFQAEDETPISDNNYNESENQSEINQTIENPSENTENIQPNMQTPFENKYSMVYQCTLCNEKEILKEKIIEHFQIIHKLSSFNKYCIIVFECMKCKLKILTVDLLVNHSCMKLTQKRILVDEYKCTNCNSYYSNLKKCNNHIRKKHKMKAGIEKEEVIKFYCKICYKVFNIKKDLYTHKNCAMRYSCYYCNKKFEDKYDIEKHILEHIEDDTCHVKVRVNKIVNETESTEELDDIFGEDEDDITQPLDISIPVNIIDNYISTCWYNCLICSCISYSSDNIIKHVKKSHNIDIYNSRPDMMKIYKCIICNYYFNDLDLFIKHIELLHNCSLCDDFNYQKTDLLKEHLKTVHDENEFIEFKMKENRCDVLKCKDDYVMMSKKELQCKICELQYPTLDHLQAHVNLVHQTIPNKGCYGYGKRLFKIIKIDYFRCTKCPESFVNIKDIKKHVKIEHLDHFMVYFE